MDLLHGKLMVSPFEEVPFMVASQRISEFLKPNLYPGLSSRDQLKLCAFKRICTDHPSDKWAQLRFSNHSARCSFLSIQKNHSAVSHSPFFTREELNRQCYIRNLRNQNKCSRYVAVRSELAESGVPDSAYPLSEFKFGSKFEGLENLPPPDTSAVYVSNHQSFLDIYTLLILGRSFKFISKTSIFLFPIIGWAMFMLGTIPLKRMNSKSQLDCLKRCMDLIKKGSSVFFFPEGTRSKDGKLGAFKKGAFSVAAKTGVPIVPMTLIGTGKIMPTGMESIVNQGSVKVVIHKPIQGRDPAALCNEARNVISEALNRQ
ncbi:1-acyl-sn-glycerol-3-phosphate acyltransferase LPAT1, chloroplastic isoform X3 [Tripterygium wilfordii]|uniref:1-acyl-sn-glycerol-3-phosphate acyltransferase LPAT1, chloroplastic isoform X3 n=1 Tax=Tripterygium wilfordii TaxID=458696 RepID=UPI0018F8151A|nr:1-acyl-sn-glycerol-3-phosphate acyltransferase LPAT1, chloroplastic isoform X3 [Tripterygium wilfordii]